MILIKELYPREQEGTDSCLVHPGYSCGSTGKPLLVALGARGAKQRER